MKATTFGSGLGRRNSDNTLVSSNDAIRTERRGSSEPQAAGFKTHSSFGRRHQSKHHKCAICAQLCKKCDNKGRTMHCIEGDTANDAWCNARSLLEMPDAARNVDGRGGRTCEALHVISRIRRPRDRWTVARTPPINPAFAIAEVVWIVNGCDDSAFLNRWNSKLPEFAGWGPKYEGAYGARLRSRFGLDQIRRVCEALSSNSGSRQAVLQIWDASCDLPHPDGSPVSWDVPCNICSLLKIRNGRLEWSQIMRSNDLYLGLPYNFVQFTYLQEILAGCLQIGVGEYCHFSDSLHIYERDMERFQRVALVVPAANTDELNAPLELSDCYFREVGRTIDMLWETTSDEYCRIATSAQVPKAYINLLLIMAAERARRRRMGDEVAKCLQACTNPALKQTYGLWLYSHRAMSEEGAGG